MAQNKLITDLVSLVTPNNDDIFVIVDNTTNPSLSVTKKISFANLKESLQDMIDLLVTEGTGISATYDDSGNTLTIAVVADTTTQKTIISSGGTNVGTRQELNVIPGASIALSGVDNPTDNRVDLTIKNTGVSTATSLSASGSTYDVLSAIDTLGDGTQAVRLRTLKAASTKVSLAFSDASNAVAIDIDPSAIGINDLSITSPLALAQGGTNATTASGARANLGAAKAGANNDITAISGLTTALSISQGGTAGTTSQDALQNLGGLKYIADVATVGESLIVNQSTLVSNEYRGELKGVRAASNKIAISTISNDVAVDVNADNVLNASSNNINFNANRLTNVADPISSNDAASKSYVDSVAQGLTVKDAVTVASTSNLAGTYSNANQTLTLGSTGVLSIDGVTTTLGMRVLLKDQSQGSQNGIYSVTTEGAVGVAAVFTRADDFNSNAEIDAGSFCFVLSGTTNAGKQFVQTATSPTLDTTGLTFSILADSSINDDSISNAKLENMEANRIKGATVSGDPSDLTADQAITVLNSASTNTINQARLVLTGAIDGNARTAISVGGSDAGTRRKINFIAGSNISISAVDDSGNEEVDVTISSTAGGGGVSLGLAVALG
jgi:hypothetical protein